jgi:hypothetical protein
VFCFRKKSTLQFAILRFWIRLLLIVISATSGAAAEQQALPVQGNRSEVRRGEEKRNRNPVGSEVDAVQKNASLDRTNRLRNGRSETGAPPEIPAFREPVELETANVGLQFTADGGQRVRGREAAQGEQRAEKTFQNQDPELEFIKFTPSGIARPDEEGGAEQVGNRLGDSPASRAVQDMIGRNNEEERIFREQARQSAIASLQAEEAARQQSNQAASNQNFARQAIEKEASRRENSANALATEQQKSEARAEFFERLRDDADRQRQLGKLFLEQQDIAFIGKRANVTA